MVKFSDILLISDGKHIAKIIAYGLNYFSGIYILLITANHAEEKVLKVDNELNRILKNVYKYVFETFYINLVLPGVSYLSSCKISGGGTYERMALTNSVLKK